MKPVCAFLSSLILIVSAPLPAEPQAESRALAFTHVTVIDATGAAARPDMTVVIAGERIAAVGESVRIPEGARVIDAGGKFLIPGLWDMHTHLSEKDYLPLYIANGVTGVRFMRGRPAHYEWRQGVQSGALPGPRMIISSQHLDGPDPVNKASIAIANAAEARQAVRTVKQAGADFIKVYSLLPEEAYFAIADEAKKQGIPFAGHVPRSVTPAQVSDAGQRSIEHLSGVAFACSSREPQYAADMAKMYANLAKVGPKSNYYLFLRRLEKKYLEAYDPEKCQALFARFRKNDTWQVPTLRVTQSGALLANPDFVNPRLEYIPAARRETDPRNSSMYRNFTPADFAILEDILAKNQVIVGAMQRAGVKIMAGTDVHPVGFTLHDELALLVEAGLTPMQALQAATLNPALYLGRERDLGTVEEGKLANLVLLRANPLADIRHTEEIEAVVFNGRLLDREALDEMLAEVKGIANQEAP